MPTALSPPGLYSALRLGPSWTQNDNNSHLHNIRHRGAARRDAVRAALAAYGVRFSEAGSDSGRTGLGDAWLYWDARTGAPAGRQTPGRGSGADFVMQAQFPLPSGRIAGRIDISVTGVAVALLSARVC